MIFSFLAVSLDRQIAGSVRLDRDFDPELNDLNSAKSIELKNEFEGPLRSQFCHGSSNCSLTITSFSQGSVIINFLVALYSGQVTDCEALASLNSAMNSLAIPGISPGSFSSGKPLAFKILPSYSLIIPF